MNRTNKIYNLGLKNKRKLIVDTSDQDYIDHRIKIKNINLQFDMRTGSGVGNLSVGTFDLSTI